MHPSEEHKTDFSVTFDNITSQEILIFHSHFILHSDSSSAVLFSVLLESCLYRMLLIVTLMWIFLLSITGSYFSSHCLEEFAGEMSCLVWGSVPTALVSQLGVRRWIPFPEQNRTVLLCSLEGYCGLWRNRKATIGIKKGKGRERQL